MLLSKRGKKTEERVFIHSYYLGRGGKMIHLTGDLWSKEFARSPMWDVSIEHERGDVGPGFHGAKAKPTHTSVLLVHIFLSWTIN